MNICDRIMFCTISFINLFLDLKHHGDILIYYGLVVIPQDKICCLGQGVIPPSPLATLPNLILFRGL